VGVTAGAGRAEVMKRCRWRLGGEASGVGEVGVVDNCVCRLTAKRDVSREERLSSDDFLVRLKILKCSSKGLYND